MMLGPCKRVVNMCRLHFIGAVVIHLLCAMSNGNINEIAARNAIRMSDRLKRSRLQHSLLLSVSLQDGRRKRVE